MHSLVNVDTCSKFTHPSLSALQNYLRKMMKIWNWIGLGFWNLTWILKPKSPYIYSQGMLNVNFYVNFIDKGGGETSTEGTGNNALKKGTLVNFCFLLKSMLKFLSDWVGRFFVFQDVSLNEKTLINVKPLFQVYNQIHVRFAKWF